MEKKLCACNCGEYTKPGNQFINGHNGKLNKGRKHTEEQNKQHSIRMQGFKHTEERNKQIGIKMKGKQNSLGYKHTEEAKEKNRLAHLGIITSLKTIEKWKLVANRPEAIEKRRL